MNIKNKQLKNLYKFENIYFITIIVYDKKS